MDFSQPIHINFITNQVHTFGFCPLTRLQLYKGDPVYWDCNCTDFEAHSVIRDSDKPNFLPCRIPVNSQLSTSKWLSYLSDYWMSVGRFIGIWLPLDFSRDNDLSSTEENHASALQNPCHVQAYSEGELSFKAVLCPFQDKPIPLHVSLLMVR